MEMLDKYSYLQNAPFWSEALPYKEAAFPGGGYAALSYMDGGFGFSEVIIKGLFGVSNSSSITEIKPRIPSGFGDAALTNLNVQGHKLNIHINQSDTAHQIEMQPGRKRDSSGPLQNHTRLRYGTDGEKEVNFSFRNLIPGYYDIKIYNSPNDRDSYDYRSTPLISQSLVATDNEGVLRYDSDSWNGAYIIEVCYHEGDLSQNGEIDSQDAAILLDEWGTDTSPEADFNTDGTVNGWDFGRIRYIIGEGNSLP